MKCPHCQQEKVVKNGSSLPLRIFSPEAAKTLTAKIRSILAPDGRWVQYSYWLGNGRAEATTAGKLVDANPGISQLSRTGFP